MAENAEKTPTELEDRDEEAPEEIPVRKGGEGEVVSPEEGGGEEDAPLPDLSWVAVAAEKAKEDLQEEESEGAIDDHDQSRLPEAVREGAAVIAQLGYAFDTTRQGQRWHETEPVRAANVYLRYTLRSTK